MLAAGHGGSRLRGSQSSEYRKSWASLKTTNSYTIEIHIIFDPPMIGSADQRRERPSSGLPRERNDHPRRLAGRHRDGLSGLARSSSWLDVPLRCALTIAMQTSGWPGTADSMCESREGEEQRQHHRSRQPCDKDGAAQGTAQNNLATPGLLGRIRRWRLSVPVGHRKIGLLPPRVLWSQIKTAPKVPGPSRRKP
jgi:hypothetical protein